MRTLTAATYDDKGDLVLSGGRGKWTMRRWIELDPALDLIQRWFDDPAAETIDPTLEYDTDALLKEHGRA